MTYFRESEPEEGPYLDIHKKSIPKGEEDKYYKSGNMHPFSMKDYKANKTEVDKATKRIVGLIKTIRKADDNANF